MSKCEKKILNWIEKHRIVIFLAIISIVALYARYRMLSYRSTDYSCFLGPWFDYFKTNGGLNALKDFPGDYNAPYMTIMALLSYIPVKAIYLIKSVSVVFDFVLAISGSFLIFKLTKKKWLSYFTYAVLLFLPQVLLNGAFWGQCDSMYSSFCIMSLIFLLDKKYTRSFIMLGLAFAFKLQFIFILPLYVVLYFSKKEFSILNFLIIPLVNMILCLPAVIAGKDFIDCMFIYYHQTGTYNYALQMNFVNMYQFFTNGVSFIKPIGICLTVVLCFTTLIYVLEKKVKWDNEKIITLALWFLVVVTFTLPCMHDRYLFLGEILSIIYYICYRKNGLLVAIININAIVTYTAFLFKIDVVNMRYLAIIYLILILDFTRNTFTLLNESKK